MTLIVEDGTGLANADALISTEFADAIHDDHGNVTWETHDQLEKEAAIRNASTFLTYSLVWAGWPSNERTQALSFPRTGLWDADGYDVSSDAVPKEVQRATAFLALFDADNAGAITTPNFEYNKTLIRKRIGPIEKEYAVIRNDPQSARPTVLFAMEMIRPFLKGGAAGGSALTGTRSR
jgi:hypothetical protein